MHLNLYKKVAGNDTLFRAYLDEWVYGVNSQEEYLEKVGVTQLQRIKANSVLGYAAGLDRK